MKENKSLKDVSEYLNQIEYVKEKVNFIKKEIPDIQVKIHKSEISFFPIFASKSVNQEYTELEFYRSYGTLTVIPYRLLNFTYNGTTEVIKIYSNPRSSRLAYLSNSYNKTTGKLQYCINFSKIAINFQNNNFSEKMLTNCRLKILEFMRKYPNHTLNIKHMDPKLKNLIVFT